MRRYAFAALALAFAWFGVGPGKGTIEAAGRAGRTTAASTAAATPPLGHAACPVPGARISSGWGPRAGGFHDGVDLAASIGTPIRAVLAGIVTHSAHDDPGGYGAYIDITNAAGRQQYGHESKRLVRVGQHVRAGQVIALVGQEGASTGPHLHLRIYQPRAGAGVDPVRWLHSRGVRLPCGG